MAISGLVPWLRPLRFYPAQSDACIGKSVYVNFTLPFILETEYRMRKLLPSLLLFLATATSVEAVPLQLTQQGRLLEPSGAAVSGLHDLTFRIYDDSTSGVLLWEEVITVDFTNGYYAAVLGADELNNPLDSTVLSMYPIYIELELDTNGPMSPRQAINSAPYAQMAGVAENVNGGTVNASEVSINGSAVINGSGEWVGTINVDWNTQIVNMPSDIADGDDNTQLSESDVEDYITNASIDLAAGSMMNGSTLLTADDTLMPDWSDIQNRPTGLDDGDDDTQLSESQVEGFITNDGIDLDVTTTIGGMDILTTDSDSLGMLSCQNDGDVPHWDSVFGWYCDADVDTTLSELEVEDYITNDPVDLAAGSMMDGSLLVTAADTISPDWSDIQNRPTGLDDGDDDTQLSSSQVIGYVEGGSVNLAIGSQVNGRTLVGQPSTCSNGQVLVYDATSNDWGCGDDTDTTLTPSEMQTAVEAMTLNLQNLPQVNGVDVLTANSTVNPNNIDSSTGSESQVLTIVTGVPQWEDVQGGCHHETLYGTDGDFYAYVECSNTSYIHPINADVSSSNGGTSVVELAEVGSLAYNTYCGIKSDSTVQCWGIDVNNQITDTPTDTFSTLIAGYTFHCGLTTQGEVLCWGSDSGGSVSNAPSGTFASLSVGQRNACAIDTSGHLTCWGQDGYGSVSSAPTSGSFSQALMSEQAGCALTTAGEVTCWGNNTDGIVSNAPSGVFAKIFIGEEQTSACALTSQGDLTCWGNNNYNQVSNVPSSTFTDIAIGYYHICGINSNQELECWGDTSNGLSNVPSGTFSHVQSSRWSSCALHTNGELYCWGRISSDYSHSPGLTWTDFAMHQMNVCALMANGAISCWGDDVPESTCATLSNGTTLCWNGNELSDWTNP